MNNTKLARLLGASIVAATLGLGCFFLSSGGDASAQPTRQPFGNAVQQRAEMVRELKETNALLKEQNALLRQIAGKRKMGKAAQSWWFAFCRRNEPSTNTRSGPTPPTGPGFRALRSRAAGFSLVELMVVIAIVAILAGAVITQTRPTVDEGLRTTAQVVATDMDYARELAVAGSSSYRITFDVAGNSYRLTHTGADSRLDTLPRSPFGDPEDPPTQWTQRLSDLPHLGPQVTLHAVLRRVAAPSVVDGGFRASEGITPSYVEFGPLGETAQSKPTVIWLAAGSGDARRYISVTINPVTGVSSIGNLQATSP